MEMNAYLRAGFMFVIAICAYFGTKIILKQHNAEISWYRYTWHVYIFGLAGLGILLQEWRWIDFEIFRNFTSHDYSTIVQVSRLPWIIIGSIVGILILVLLYFAFSGSSGIKVLPDGLYDKKLKLVLLGALYAYQQDGNLNTLSLGLTKSKMQTILEKRWGLYSSEEVINKLDYLLNNDYNESVLPIIIQAVKEDQKYDFLINHYNIDNSNDYDEENDNTTSEMLDQFDRFERAYTRSNHLMETYGELKHNKIIEKYSDITKYGIYGRDLGRLVFIARLAYDYGYLSEEQTWKYLNQAYDKAKKSYRNWDEFFKSYIIGRALRGGANNHNSDIINLSKDLLENKKSPLYELSF